MEADTGTSQAGEGEKDDDGEEETDQRYPQTDQRQSVHRHVKAGGLVVQTGTVVGPASATLI